jgi:hypothetical protein
VPCAVSAGHDKCQGHETLPLKFDPASSLSVPAPPSAKMTFWSEAGPNSSVATPLIVALPPPLTAPWRVMLPPSAHRLPKFTSPPV